MIEEKLNFREDLIWLCFLDYITTFEQVGILKHKQNEHNKSQDSQKSSSN